MTLMMTPGPNEPTADGLQEYSKLIVDELIELADGGIVVGKTPERPNGT
jgi:hypothetical protein